MPRVFSAKIIFTLLFLLIADFCVMPYLNFFGFPPVLLYLMILYALFEWAVESAIKMALMVGLFRDLSGSNAIGLETIVLASATLGLCFLVQKIDRQSLIMRFLISFLFVLAASVTVLVFSSAMPDSEGVTGYAVKASFGSALITALFSPFVFYAAGRWFGQRAILKQYELFR